MRKRKPPESLPVIPADLLRPPLVLVTWEDATMLDTGAWVDHPERHDYKPVLVEQVGFLLHESDAGIILTHAWHADQMAPRDQIPRGMIRKITRLKG